MEKGGGDNGVAGGAVVDDMGESMQCSNHPYKTNPGGICAFCLQEKLGKLLSSSQSNASFFPSSASPSFRSDNGGGGGGVNGGLSFAGTSSSSSIPSSSTSSAKKKLKKIVASNNNNTSLVLMRSKSSSSGPAPIRRHHHHHHHLFDGDEYTPRKGGFWSFLHISARKHHRDHKNKGESKPSVHPATINNNNTHTPAAKEKSLGVAESSSSRKGDYGDENESPNSSHASSSSFGRKVARSRSVGCGSRSFSGDLLERISTGFGDCTLRRVESQREAKQPKGVGMRGGGRGGMGMGEHHHRIKERVKCGGIFGGFSSSSSSSSYWASSSEEVNQSNENRKDVVGIEHRSNSIQPHSRHKSWGWAFASPMRAFKSSKPEEKIAASGNAVNNNANAPTPNLAAIPSLLTVRS